MKDNKPFHRRFLILGASLLILGDCVLTGCGPKGNAKTGEESSQSVVSAKDRPPLKVVMVDANFSKELGIQWQASSEQPLSIETISLEEMRNRKQDSTDVWIFPANLLGEMVGKECIGPLPTGAFGKPPADPDSTATSKSETPADLWPARWRGASRYGGTVYAMPLGAKPLVFLARDVDVSPLNAAEPTVGRSEELSQKSRDAWLATLQSLPTETPPESIPWNQMQNDRLVDHFLFIASTTNARYRGLFDISKMSARLDTSDLVQSATILAELWRVCPDSILNSASDAWQRVLTSQKQSFAIGYPVAMDSFEPSNNSTLQVANLSWNPNHGLLVAIGKKTRQSAVSNQLVSWLSAPEQRAILSKLDNRIELWPTQPDQNAGRNDHRLYTNLINKEIRPEPTSLLIRFQNSHIYRQKLAETLRACLQTPEQSKSLLAECAQAWDQITEQNNAPQQRLSVEQSIGFSQ